MLLRQPDGPPGCDRRLSRRLLLTELGTSAVGVVVLAACGSDGGQSTSDPTASTSNDSDPADPPSDSGGGADPLQWHHVSLEFVSMG